MLPCHLLVCKQWRFRRLISSFECEKFKESWVSHTVPRKWTWVLNKGVRANLVVVVDHLPKNSRKLPKFLQNRRKETRIIWCTYLVMLRLTLIHEGLEIPHTNYVVQCNMVPSNCKVNMYMHIRIWSPSSNGLVQIKLALPHLLQFKTENNLSSIKSNIHTHANFFKN